MIHTKDTLQVGAEFVKLFIELHPITGVPEVKKSFSGWISDRFVEETISMGTIERVSVVINGSEIYETDMDLSSISCENDPLAICVTPDVEAFYMDPKNFPNDALAKFYMSQMQQPHIEAEYIHVHYGPKEILPNMEESNEYIQIIYGPQEMLPNGQKTGIVPVYLK